MAESLLRSDDLLDFDEPAVKEFAERFVIDRSDPVSIASQLYYAVRDGIRYEVFDVRLSVSGIAASAVVEQGRGFCLHKSILFVACCRRFGIPARLVASTVRNHLSTPALEHLVGGTRFLHWCAQIELNGRWLTMTPVFDRLLCRVYGVQPLDFDARNDSIAQSSGTGTVMHFDTGPWPVDTAHPHEVIGLVALHHPRMVTDSGRVPRERDIAREIETSENERIKDDA